MCGIKRPSLALTITYILTQLPLTLTQLPLSYTHMLETTPCCPVSHSRTHSHNSRSHTHSRHHPLLPSNVSPFTNRQDQIDVFQTPQFTLTVTLVGGSIKVNQGSENHRNTERFRRGLVFKVHRSLYHSTLGSRFRKKKEKTPSI